MYILGEKFPLADTDNDGIRWYVLKGIHLVGTLGCGDLSARAGNNEDCIEEKSTAIHWVKLSETNLFVTIIFKTCLCRTAL